MRAHPQDTVTSWGNGLLSVSRQVDHLHLGERRDVDWGRFFRPSGLYTWQKDFAARLAAHTPPRTLRWAAFFGDANHKVVPVASGARVTLAFELYRERPPTNPPHPGAGRPRVRAVP